VTQTEFGKDAGRWSKSPEEARKQADGDARLLLVDFYTPTGDGAGPVVAVSYRDPAGLQGSSRSTQAVNVKPKTGSTPNPWCRITGCPRTVHALVPDGRSRSRAPRHSCDRTRSIVCDRSG
jgi:hypothetical protein